MDDIIKQLFEQCGLDPFQSDEVMNLIDSTIDKHFGGSNDDLSIHGNAGFGEIATHERADLLRRKEEIPGSCEF